MRFNTKHKKWIFIVLFSILLVLIALMLSPYIKGIFVGALVAYFLFPLHQKLSKVFRSQKLSQVFLSLLSVIVMLAVLAVFFIPLASQLQDLRGHSSEYIDEIVELIPDCQVQDQSFYCVAGGRFISSLTKEEIMDKSSQYLSKISSYVVQGTFGIISSLFTLLMFLVIMVFSTYYFLENGTQFIREIYDLLPLSPKNKKRVMTRLEETIRAVVGGNIITSLMQGVIGGVIFFVTGVPFAFVLGLLTAILAFLPLVGAPFVWIPVVIYLVLQGAYVKAVIVAILSFVILGSIDNFLKPKLIGDKIKMTSFTMFLAVLGGLHLFGVLGIFFGPIVFALVVTFTSMYKDID